MRYICLLGAVLLVAQPLSSQEPIGLHAAELRAIRDIIGTRTWEPAFRQNLSGRLLAVLSEATTRMVIVHPNNIVEFRRGAPTAGNVFSAELFRGARTDYRRLDRLLKEKQVKTYIHTWASYEAGPHDQQQRYRFVLARMDSLGIPQDLQERVLAAVGQDLAEHPMVVGNDVVLTAALNAFTLRESQRVRNIQIQRFAVDTTRSGAELWSNYLATVFSRSGIVLAADSSATGIFATDIAPDVRGYVDFSQLAGDKLSSPKEFEAAVTSGKVRFFVARPGERVPWRVPPATLSSVLHQSTPPE